MKTCLPIFAILVSVFVSGCGDMLGDPEADRLRAQKEEERQLEVERSEMATAMTKYVTDRLKLLEDSLKEISPGIAELKRDADALSRAMAAAESALTSKGEECNLETKLLRMMKDSEINRLAVKYLASDFSLEVSTYVEKVRNARVQETKYNAELQHLDSVYKEAVATSEKWAKASKVQREEEITRLKQELAALETRRATENKNYSQQGKRSLSGGKTVERARYEAQISLERRIRDIDDQIDKKRQQLDYLLNPSNIRRVEASASYDAQRIQQRAVDLRRSSTYDVEKMKPKNMVADVVDEYAGRTVGALKKVLTEKLVTLTKAEDGCCANIRTVKEISIAIPIATLPELRRLRARLEQLGQ